MNRIDKKLAALHASGKKMLSPYITAGDPTPESTVPLMHALAKAGADILELGIPFSDPMAEGPVIQAAMERALAQGVHCQQVLDMVKQFRLQDQHTPVVVMGYVNPIEQYGYERFAKQAHDAGVDGTILVDLPPEESPSVLAIWQEAGLYPIFLCSPTTSPERFKQIASCARGYLYYVSIKGVTGSDAFDAEAVASAYLQRKAHCKLPIMIGFGIKTPQMAAKVAAFADGVIVGAALINEIYSAFIEKRDSIQTGAQFIQAMRSAMDHGN